MKDFFYYNRGERNGILLLIFLVIIIYAYPIISSTSSSTTDYSSAKEDLLAFKASLEHQAPNQGFKNNRSKTPFYDKKGKKVVTLKPFDFDPNIVGEADLDKMNLPSRTIKSILKYREKGGQFRYKNSLQKIYTLSEEHYQQLLPFIQLPKQNTASKRMLN